jgi:hypothetical protein
MSGRDKAYEESIMDIGLVLDIVEIVAVVLVAVTVIVIVIEKK